MNHASSSRHHAPPTPMTNTTMAIEGATAMPQPIESNAAIARRPSLQSPKILPLFYAYQSTMHSSNNSPFHHTHRTSCPITPTIQSLNANVALFHKYFYSPRHFPKILSGIMLIGGVAGYKTMEFYYGGRQEKSYRYVETTKPKSLDPRYRSKEKKEMLQRKITLRAEEFRGLTRKTTQFW